MEQATTKPEVWIDGLGIARGGSVRLVGTHNPWVERWQSDGAERKRRIRARGDPALGMPRGDDRNVLQALVDLHHAGSDLSDTDLGLSRLSAAVRRRGPSLGRHHLLASLHRLAGLRVHVASFRRGEGDVHPSVVPPVAAWAPLRMDWVWTAGPIRWLSMETTPGQGRSLLVALRLDPLFLDHARIEKDRWTDLAIPPARGGVVLP